MGRSKFKGKIMSFIYKMPLDHHVKMVRKLVCHCGISGRNLLSDVAENHKISQLVKCVGIVWSYGKEKWA
jgi:hypothetical protein